MTVPSLVGRERELGVLEGWLDGVAASAGVLALVSGEPGIGKSRLLETAAARAEHRGFAVAWGRAWEVSSAPPYWPWIEALRVLLARPHGRDGAEALLRQLPELDRSAPTTSSPDPFPLYDAVVGYLHAAAVREPIVLVLDDLHAADLSSLQLAERVATQLRGMRAALLGSYRDVEARLSPALESALARLGRRGDTLPLQRLDREAVATLVREATGRDDRESTRMIHDASDGNPLFVRELLKLLAARGAAAGDVPAGVRAVIRERFALLAPATVALLQAAAVVGRTFGVALAAEVAGVTAAALEEAIGEAATADVVTLVEPGRYRFSHALVAETLTSGLSAPVRARLHRRAAETLARRHAEDPAAPFAEIAHHWLAVGADAAAEALTAIERAALQARSRLAFADAAEHAERALGVLATHAPGDARRRAELLIDQTESWVRAGERDRAKAPCVAACEVASSLGDGSLYARAALAYGADVAVATIDRTLIHVLEQALTLLPVGDDPWRAKVMARLGAAYQPAFDTLPPMTMAHDAIAMARRLGDPAVLHDVMFSAIGALTDFERPEKRAPLNAEVARVAAANGDRGRQLRSLQRLAFDMIDLGDLAGFERAVAEYEVIGNATGQLRYRWQPAMFRAMRAQWEGKDAEAERLLDEACSIRMQLGEPIAMIRKVRHGMLHDIAEADIDLMAEVLAEGHEIFERLIRAWAHARGKRHDQARAIAATLQRSLDGHVDLHAAGLLADLAWELRDRDLATRMFERLQDECGRPRMVTSAAFVLTGCFDHALMRMAIVLGRSEDAERFASSALALCERLGAAPFAHAIREELAAHHLEPARPAAPAPSSDRVIAACEGEFWTVRGCGELCRIKDSRGMQILAKLLASPGVEIHVLDLLGADAVDGGDAGEVLDKTARTAYQAKLRELREELAEAEQWNDAGRRERVATQIEALAAQLSGAYGLGGRERRSGAAVERARQNVRRRIADAMGRIAEAAPALGRHLDIAIRTGTSCIYNPDR